MRRRTNTTLSNTFNKEQYVEKELQDKFTLWMLRIIIKLNGFNKLLNNYGNFTEDNIAHFLNLGAYVDQEDELDSKAVYRELLLQAERFEKRKRFSTLKTLDRNIQKISKMMHLNTYEERILEFTILLNQYDILDTAAELIGNELNSNQVKRALSVILDIPYKEVEKAFALDSKFSRSSIITFWTMNTNSLKTKLDLISDEFCNNMLSADGEIEDMLKGIILKCEPSELKLSDFEHLKEDLDVMMPYLEHAFASEQKGVNVLLYGVPGTGKTELTKSIAEHLNKRLFEISYTDDENEPTEGSKRLKAYKSAQALLSNKDTMFLFDEIEDVLNGGDFFFNPRQKNKAWINRILETNPIPTIWITNNVNSIDNAIIRRFDMAIKVPIPTKEKRKEILHRYSDNQIGTETIAKLAANETIAPALVSRAAKVVSSLKSEEKDKVFEVVINNTLKAQGYQGIKETPKIDLPKSYDPSYINSDMDLDKLTKGIANNPNARICLYGPAGTGKSAYGKYVAEKLDKPIIIKKGSDLLSMYVGGTEQNIARAFEEAKEEEAVLVFDEVDSFLADRSSAQRNWEITQVNEMLVQMESYNGIFIATTNLMDNLDKASLRRFDLKLEFGFLKPEKAWQLFTSECKNIGLENIPQALQRSIESLAYLTPGDFAAVLRQNRFNLIEDANDFLNRLREEVAVKNMSDSNKMGFAV